jgi:acetylornithine deacetylase/succinyl-diaminopimelate desuccinylase-like protein
MPVESSTADPEVYKRPAELLRSLLRFNTTNPPGNESECIAYIKSLLAAAGFDVTILALDSARPNLITRLKGRGDAPPLLLYGHVDVPPSRDQAWRHPPFEARLAEGAIWGKGALDMKSGVVMMLSAILRARAEGLHPSGDIVLAIVSDQETGGTLGIKYLIDSHAELFEGVRHAISKFGGFTLFFGGRKFYPIQVSEVQLGWVRAVARSGGGRGDALGKMCRLLGRLAATRLPTHITPPVKQMIEAMTAALPAPTCDLLAGLLDAQKTDTILDRLGKQARHFDGLLHNSVSLIAFPERGLIPITQEEIEVKLAVHVLPGFGIEQAVGEIAALAGDDAKLEILSFVPAPPQPDMGMFNLLTDLIREADPSGVPVPFVLAGVSAAKLFARLGIQTYGFLPMNLPEAISLPSMLQTPDERITAASLEFGCDCLYRLLQCYPGRTYSTGLK